MKMHFCNFLKNQRYNNIDYIKINQKRRKRKNEQIFNSFNCSDKVLGKYNKNIVMN